jgi:N-acetyl-ornithine/N-acetyl-lysine deacetylase
MANEAPLSETLRGLVTHYSPSGQEKGATWWLTAHMRTLGYERAFIDAAGNAVGIMGHGSRQLVLLGHIDTVPGEIVPHLEDGVFYGRGVVDAKGPLAAFTDAVAQVGPNEGWQLVVIGAVEEESSSKGAHFLVDQYQPEAAIIGEPNQWERIALGYKGSAWAKISVQRAQSHSASGAETACEAAVEIWRAIQTYASDYNAGKTRAFDKLLPTLRTIQSGQEDFTQWARLSVGARLPLELSPEEWYAQLHQLAPGCKIGRVGTPIPAWSCEKNSKLVRAFLAAIRAQGGSPAFVYKTGTADLNIVAPAWNCPALVYGPGDSALDHTPNEQLSLAEYQQAVTILTAALRQLTRNL